MDKKGFIRTQIRRGNDIQVSLSLMNGTEVYDMANVTDVTVTVVSVTHPECKIAVSDFEVSNPLILNIPGSNTLLPNVVPDGAYRIIVGFMDGDRRVTVDSVAFSIVDYNFQAFEVDEMTSVYYVQAYAVVQVFGGGGGGIPDAPMDGIQYGRQDGEWTEIVSGGGGTNDHSLLENRELPNQHPIQAITGLQYELDTKISRLGDTMSGALTLNGDPTAPGMAANKDYVDKRLAELESTALTFRGFIATSEPTVDLREGNLWYESENENTTFPWQVRTYTNGAWSAETTEYTPVALDLWSRLSDNAGIYYFGENWQQLDFAGNTFNQTQFQTVSGVVNLAPGGITNNEIATNAGIDQSKISGLADSLSGKVDKVNVANQVYATDGSGNQTTIPVDGSGGLVMRDGDNISVPASVSGDNAIGANQVSDNFVHKTGNVDETITGRKTFAVGGAGAVSADEPGDLDFVVKAGVRTKLWEIWNNIIHQSNQVDQSYWVDTNGLVHAFSTNDTDPNTFFGTSTSVTFNGITVSKSNVRAIHFGSEWSYVTVTNTADFCSYFYAPNFSVDFRPWQKSNLVGTNLMSVNQNMYYADISEMTALRNLCFNQCSKLRILNIGNKTITRPQTGFNGVPNVSTSVIYADTLALGNAFKNSIPQLSNWTVEVLRYDPHVETIEEKFRGIKSTYQPLLTQANAGDGITIDTTNPLAPVISSSGGSGSDIVETDVTEMFKTNVPVEDFAVRLVQYPGKKPFIRMLAQDTSGVANTLIVTPDIGFGSAYDKTGNNAVIQHGIDDNGSVAHYAVNITQERQTVNTTMSFDPHIHDIDLSYWVGSLQGSYWVDTNLIAHPFSVEDTPLINFNRSAPDLDNITINGQLVNISNIQRIYFGMSYASEDNSKIKINWLNDYPNITYLNLGGLKSISTTPSGFVQYALKLQVLVLDGMDSIKTISGSFISQAPVLRRIEIGSIDFANITIPYGIFNNVNNVSSSVIVANSQQLADNLKAKAPTLSNWSVEITQP